MSLIRQWVLTCDACGRDYAETMFGVEREGHTTRDAVAVLARTDGWTIGRECRCPGCKP